jgi:hypothetical protein
MSCKEILKQTKIKGSSEYIEATTFVSTEPRSGQLIQKECIFLKKEKEKGRASLNSPCKLPSLPAATHATNCTT